jgi:amino acid adenylation domain-containing protein
MIVSLVGILKAGGAYLPLDPRNPAERLRYMLEEGRPQVVLTEGRLAGALPKYGVEKLLTDDDESLMREQSEWNPSRRVGGGNLAYIIYTSGSTGQPKGVSVTQRNVARLVKNNLYATLDEWRILLQNAPLAFDASTFELWGALLNGGRLILMAEEEADVWEMEEVIERERITTLWLTASLFNAVVDDKGGVEKLRGVGQALVGGEALSPSHVRVAVERLPGTELINGYGPTEVTTFSCCHRIRGKDLGDGKSIPIGRAIANTEIFILDERRSVAPVGVNGELYIGGEGVARGYLERPELTAERFVPNPYGRGYGERAYRTGDIVRWQEDGNVEFLGRKDEQVKIRGHRIELGEIEARLCEHEAVEEAAVIAREEGGEKSLVGYVVMRNGEEGRVSELREYLKERLTKYMTPGEYISLERLPLTANGKLDKKALLELESIAYRATESVDEPRNDVEEALLQIWKQVLRVDRIGIKDNFFELGGHSLRVIQVIARIRDHFDIVLSPRAIFESPTVQELSLLIIHAQVMQADDEEVYMMLMELANLPDLETQQAEAP